MPLSYLLTLDYLEKFNGSVLVMVIWHCILGLIILEMHRKSEALVITLAARHLQLGY